jgi:glycosyltransferase involved in cell wall biosynthesis
MTERPTVSVALACYNGEQFIGAQLLSIRDQTVLPDEVVVSDGGSTDRTVAIVAEFFSTYPELNGRLVVDGTRLGVTKNFERAIASTTGGLVALCDQDDLWSPDRLRLAIEAFGDDSVLLVNSDARLVDLEGTPLGLTLFETLGVGDDELAALAGRSAFELLIRRNLVTGATVMLRRELAERAMPFPEEWVHDEWLAVIAAVTGRLLPLRDRLIDYRQHGGNQIGVTAPTLRHRVGRMLQARGDRYVQLAIRSAVLAARLDSMDADPRWRELAHRKSSFEERRSRYGRIRAARLIPILRNAASGAYPALSSQGRLDIVRDLVQPS